MESPGARASERPQVDQSGGVEVTDECESSIGVRMVFAVAGGVGVEAGVGVFTGLGAGWFTRRPPSR